MFIKKGEIIVNDSVMSYFLLNLNMFHRLS